MALVGRIFVIAFALLFATVAASMVTAGAMIGSVFHGEMIERVFYWGMVMLASGFTLAGGLIPLLIIVALTEALRLRSLLAYVAGAAFLMLVAYYAAGAPGRYEESIDTAPSPVSREAEFAIAAGAAFGFVYWLIAGRNAGRWRDRQVA
jgi:hypothetical protein